MKKGFLLSPLTFHVKKISAAALQTNTITNTTEMGDMARSIHGFWVLCELWLETSKIRELYQKMVLQRYDASKHKH
uniref:Uncharacterized protein n=1 Tax=Knipowitschia caucasica TaxID=637954 RepID=A0AAV2JP97_KNICA